MKFFDNYAFTLLPAEQFRPFSDREEMGEIPQSKQAELIRHAEEEMAKPYPRLTASLYLDFARNGDRSRHGDAYYPIRERLFYLTLGEYCEKKGRFIDELANTLWSICEETSWVISAHNVDRDQKLLGKALPDAFGDEIVAIDLFAATTAADMAWALYLLGDELDAKVDPLIRERVLFELDRRIVRPYLKYEMRWITDFINNWVPWIVSNVLTMTALVVSDDATRRAMVERSLKFLDVFTETYDDDGGCDEGPNYWNAAGASWMDALEVLYDLSGGSIDIFAHPFTRRVCEYIVDMNISNDYFVNFADCGLRCIPGPAMIYRFGERIGSDKMKAFGYRRYTDALESIDRAFYPYRYIKNLTQKMTPVEYHSKADCVCYDGLQVVTMRVGKFFAAIKGGHNNESHNHNDIGHFIVYVDGEPLLVDAGPDTYCAATFNELRYTLPSMQSCWHNLPTVGGCLQHQGEQFKADRFDFDADKKSVTVGFGKAYEAEAGILECDRTLTLNENGATVSDHIRCEKPCEVTWNFLLPDQPELLADGMCLNGITLTADAACKVELDRWELTQGSSLQRGWNRSALWRVRFTPAQSDCYDITFTLK